MLMMKTVIKLLRIKQWTKNLFLFPALFFSHRLYDMSACITVTVAALAFCFTSSAIYIFNDWCDIEADRSHIKKKYRPLASGQISIPVALTIMSACALVSILITSIFNLPLGFILILLVYLIINICYSLGCKHIPLIEMLMVSSGFVLRLIAGGVVINAHLTNWIIYCTWLLSLMLVVGKRRSDISQVNDIQNKRRSLAYYNVYFLDLMLTMLVGATLICYIMFCVSNYAGKQFGDYLYLTVPFVLIGILRFMQIIIMDKGGDDPTNVIIEDKTIIYSIILWLTTFFIIIYI